jgi:hypothetical protein
MKTFLISMLMIFSALLLIGFNCRAQSNESGRDWIDSLAVKYRTDFIENAMLRDQAVLNGLVTRLDVLYRLQTRDHCKNNAPLNAAIRKYEDEKRKQFIRTSAYKRELRSVRTNFGS